MCNADIMLYGRVVQTTQVIIDAPLARDVLQRVAIILTIVTRGFSTATGLEHARLGSTDAEVAGQQTGFEPHHKWLQEGNASN